MDTAVTERAHRGDTAGAQRAHPGDTMRTERDDPTDPAAASRRATPLASRDGGTANGSALPPRRALPGSGRGGAPCPPAMLRAKVLLVGPREVSAGRDPPHPRAAPPSPTGSLHPEGGREGGREEAGPGLRGGLG